MSERLGSHFCGSLCSGVCGGSCGHLFVFVGFRFPTIMNPSATPTSQQVQEWLPVPSALAQLVSDYLGRPFITTWAVPARGRLRLPLPRYSPSRSNLLGAAGEAPAKLVYDFVVDWGDGSACHITAHDQPEVEHEFSAEGHYTVHITGTITGLCFGLLDYRVVNRDVPRQLLNISQWGCLRLRSGHQAFKGCEKLVVSASDGPQLQDATDLSSMFEGCSSFNGDLSGWATGSVTDMTDMFEGCSSYEGGLPGSGSARRVRQKL